MDRRKFLTYMGCGCCNLMLTSCGTTPITDRRQLKLIPEAKLNAQAAQIYEKGIKFWGPMKSTVLKRDGRTDVISYPKAIWTPEGIEMFAERLSHLHFKFIYESIYGEKFETNTLEKQQETPTLS